MCLTGSPTPWDLNLSCKDKPAGKNTVSFIYSHFLRANESVKDVSGES